MSLEPVEGTSYISAEHVIGLPFLNKISKKKKKKKGNKIQSVHIAKEKTLLP